MNPYLLDLPACLSFSGGRTSGFLLRKTLDAHGGQPADLKVGFQNTGLEAEETLAFVKECGERWGCDITWTEYTVDGNNKPNFKIVDFDTASRKGEPFDALIQRKQFLPHVRARLCSDQLKVSTMTRWLKTIPAFEDGNYINAVGLRGDEPRRAIRVLADTRRDMACPLYRAGITNEDVLAFWAENDFDLDLPTNGIKSNCLGCFLKSRARLEILMLDPKLADHFAWWVAAENKPLASAPNGARFRNDRPSYAAMMHTVKTQGRLPFAGVVPEDDDTLPCMCHD